MVSSIDQPPRCLAQVHMAGMGRHELAEDEAARHAAACAASARRH